MGNQIGRIVVFTANFGGYDNVAPPPYWTDRAEYQCFTDRIGSPLEDETGWEMILQETDGLTPVMAARRTKILAHTLETDYSVWVDGNLGLLVDPHRLIEQFLSDHDLAIFRHPTRQCVYEEAVTVVTWGKAVAGEVFSQVAGYQQEGYPFKSGLYETGVLVRRHTEAMREFEREWWAQLVCGCHRDQLSFPYVAWKLGFDFNVIPGAIHQSPYIRYRSMHAGNTQ